MAPSSLVADNEKEEEEETAAAAGKKRTRKERRKQRHIIKLRRMAQYIKFVSTHAATKTNSSPQHHSTGKPTHTHTRTTKSLTETGKVAEKSMSCLSGCTKPRMWLVRSGSTKQQPKKGGRGKRKAWGKC